MTVTINAVVDADEIAAGAWMHNPVTGEIGRLNVTPAETGGRRLEADLWLQPGAAVARAHVHDHFVERFEVLAGAVGFQVAGAQQAAHPGDGRVEVPAGTVHDWWNAGDGVAHVRVEVSVTPASTGRPAARFVSMIEALWSLGALGRVNADGMPDLLWLAAIAREYRDAIRFVQPPAAIQAAVFGPLGAIARRTGATRSPPSSTGRPLPTRSPTRARVALPRCSRGRSARALLAGAASAFKAAAVIPPLSM